MADNRSPAVSMSEEIAKAKKLGASDAQAKKIAAERMADPKNVPGYNSEEYKKMKEWDKTAKSGDYYTSGKGPGNVQEDIQKYRGTQPNHHVTTGRNTTRTVGSLGGGNMPDEFMGQIK
mgnify:FL=1